MEQFPKDAFVPVGGTLTREEDWYNIEIPLKPFALDGETVSTAFQLENIELDVEDVSELAGQTLTFPVNPDEGYIDGSIYLRHAHNPADVTQIAFGAYGGGILEATLTMRVGFEFEGTGFEDTDVVLTAPLAVTEQPAA